MNLHLFGFFAALLSTLAFSNYCCADESTDTLMNGHLSYIANYRGLRFEYVTKEQKGSEHLTLRNQLSLFTPKDDGSVLWRRLWIAFRENPGESYESSGELLHRMVGFDGSTGRVFQRMYVGDSPGELPIHNGIVYAYEPVSEFTGNRFEDFLTGGPFLLPQYSDRYANFHLETVKLRSLKIVDSLQVQGVEAVLLQANIGNGLKQEFVIAPGTGHMSLSSKTWQNGKLILSSDVLELGEFNGIYYPKRGKYYSPALGKSAEESYEFEVASVEQINVPDPFFPKWPLGTVAIGPGGEFVVKDKYPKSALIRNPSRSYGSSRAIIGLVVVFLLGCLALYVLRRRTSTSR